MNYSRYASSDEWPVEEDQLWIGIEMRNLLVGVVEATNFSGETLDKG